MLKYVRWIVVIGTAVLAGQPASAQGSYPDKPIHFIIAFVPGGATAKLDITPDVLAGPAMHAKLVREIKNWTRFIDAFKAE